MATATLTLLRFFFRRTIRVYFRSVEIVGEVPAMTTSGRVFCGNHVNGLLDPVLVMLAAPCPASPIGKATLWNIPVLRWLLDAVGAVPIVRRRDDPNKAAGSNDETFARVAKHLNAGGNLLIFPEGTSHNEPHLLKLRSGAGLMLERAKRDGGTALGFQAVALEFDARDTFRSRALVVFGPARRVEDFDDVGDALAKAIMARIAEDLSDLLVEGDSWDEHRIVSRVAELYQTDEGNSSLEARNRLGRRVEAAKRFLKEAEPAELERVRAAVERYFDALASRRLQDVHIVRLRAPGDAPSLLALLVLPLALVGFAVYALPYQVPRAVVRKLGDTDDVTSTYKLGVGLLVFPLWATILSSLAFVLVPGGVALGLTGVLFGAPLAALAWLDRIDDHGSLFRALRPKRTTIAEIAELAKERAQLRATLEALRERIEDAPTRRAPPPQG